MTDEPKPVQHHRSGTTWWECCGKRLDGQKELDLHLSKSKMHKKKK